MSGAQTVPATELVAGDVILTPTTDGTGLRSTVRYVTQHGGFVIADTDTGVMRYTAKRARVRIAERAA